MRRRTVLAFGAASLLTGPARAGDWPDRPVRVVVPYAPGGPLDLVSRLVSEKLGARFGQSFVVENKPGANGAIGVQSVLASPPDGYTLLLHGSAGVTIYQAVMKQPAFEPCATSRRSRSSPISTSSCAAIRRCRSRRSRSSWSTPKPIPAS